jgi:HD-GYP domain-containing protein (c-di-GMP phosphodiesterase class II)
VILEYSERQMKIVEKDFFFDGFQLPTDVFLKLGKNKFLLIGKSGTKAFFSEYKSFKKADTDVFILSSDFLNFMNAVTNFLVNIISIKNVPHQMKIKFLRSITKVAIEQLDTKDSGSAVQLKRSSDLIVNFSVTLNSFSEVINVLQEFVPDEAYHAVSASLLALAICDEMGISQRRVVERVAMASLVHDIGLKMVSKEILDKPMHTWTLEDIRIYEMHPLHAVELLRNMKDVTNDILLMVAEHHENSMGTGYPNRIRDVSISPLGKILIVADFFSDLIMPRNNQNINLTAAQAIMYIERSLEQPFNKQVFSALKKVVGF